MAIVTNAYTLANGGFRSCYATVGYGVVLIGLWLCVCLHVQALDTKSSTTQNTTSKLYTFGVVPQFEQRKLFRIWRPILNELEKRTGYRFDLVGTPKIPAFSKQVLQGEFDFAYMNPYNILKGHNLQGYLPMVRDGGRELYGIIVVRNDSPIKTVNQLAGVNVAFPSPNALGASLLVRSELARMQIHTRQTYVQTHTSVYLHVAKQQADAGGGVLSTLLAQKKSLRNNLRILHQTQGVPPHPIAAHPRVSAEVRYAIRTALLEMASDIHGKTLLGNVPISQMIPANLDEYLAMEELKLDEFYIDVAKKASGKDALGHLNETTTDRW